jgi:hypothetical protein
VWQVIDQTGIWDQFKQGRTSKETRHKEMIQDKENQKQKNAINYAYI